MQLAGEARRKRSASSALASSGVPEALGGLRLAEAAAVASAITAELCAPPAARSAVNAYSRYVVEHGGDSPGTTAVLPVTFQKLTAFMLHRVLVARSLRSGEMLKSSG